MKKTLLFISILVMLFLFVSCNQSKNDNNDNNDNNDSDVEVNSNCALLVNGQDISKENYVYIDKDERTAYIPLLAILKALGAQIDIQADEVTIIYHGTTYILDFETYYLTEKGGASLSLVAPPPGATTCYYERLGDEFIIDTLSATYFLKIIGTTMTINYDTCVIEVNSK